MGGGDLNLKKSWHPSTMKNMEKVWKAEQQDNQEKKRIAELKREIEMEKDKEDMTKYAMEQGVIEKKEDKKLDWMYQGPNQMLNREDYLLGRAIDKPFEQMAQAEKETEQNRAPKNHVEYECIPPSLRYFSGNEQVDLARKLQEDPLYAIKKKEMETRSQLLKNPVKLRQLKQLLEERARKSKVEKRHKKKKSKKKSKQDTNDSNSDEDLDNLLTAKYNKLKGKISEKDLLMSMKKLKKEKTKKQMKKKAKDTASSSSSSDSEEANDSDETESKLRKRAEAKRRRRHSENEEDRSNQRYHRTGTTSSDTKKGYDRADRNHRNFNEDEDRLHNKSRKRDRGTSSKDSGKKSSNSGKPEVEDSNSDDREKWKTSKGNYGLIRSDGTKLLPSAKSSHLDKTKPRDKKVEEKRWVPPKRERLTEDEKEKRRQEMMVNASWRDKEREQNVRRYRDEEKREVTDRTYNKEFIRKQLAVAAEVGTVESRIKANMNNIQRSRRAMDTNFAKR